MTRSLGVGLGVAAVAIALVGRPGSSWAMGSSYEKPSVQKSQGQDSRDATRAGAAADSWQVEQSPSTKGWWRTGFLRLASRAGWQDRHSGLYS